MKQVERTNQKVLFESSYKSPSTLDRSTHTPQIGDIYQHHSDYGYFYIKLTKYVQIQGSDEQQYNHWEYEGYNFETNEWEVALTNYSNAPQKRDTISENVLKFTGTRSDSYSLLLTPFETALNISQMWVTGNLEFPETSDNELSTETALVQANKTEEELVYLLNKAEDKRNYIDEIRRCTEARIKTEERKMREIRDRINGQLTILQNQIKSIMKVITLIELYSGVNEEIFQICEGQPASNDTPLTLRQMILFMDEEVAVADNGGYDYKNKEDFYKWLLDPKHRDQIVPEQKCIVALKPRRYDKQYSSNYYDNTILNEKNKHTFVIIRNGENLYALESTNLLIYGSVFPKKSDWNTNLNSYHSEKHNQNLMYRSYIWAMLVNGLLQRSNILSPHPNTMDIFKNEDGMIHFIYDSEQTLTDGHKSWNTWLEEINSNLERGSRVIYSGQGGSHYRYYENEYLAPKAPESGLYTLEQYGNELGFLYMPNTEEWDYRIEPRKNRISWIPEKGTILNYDRICIENIDYYLNNRVERPNYLNIISLLHKLKQHFTEEQQKEDLFIEMIKNQFHGSLQSENVLDSIVRDCVNWWKYKVIWKRPITQDDKKAYRMIIKEIERRINLIK